MAYWRLSFIQQFDFKFIFDVKLGYFILVLGQRSFLLEKNQYFCCLSLSLSLFKIKVLYSMILVSYWR